MKSVNVSFCLKKKQLIQLLMNAFLCAWCRNNVSELSHLKNQHFQISQSFTVSYTYLFSGR